MDECDDDGVMLEKEGESRRQRFFQEGYRESIEGGKERLLQAGFDVGFAEGAAAGLSWGRVSAIEKTLRTYAIMRGESIDGRVKDGADEMTSLLGQVDPRQAMLSAMKQVLSKVPDEAAIRAAALDRETNDGREFGEDLPVAFERLAGLVEEEGRTRVMDNIAVDLARLGQGARRLSAHVLALLGKGLKQVSIDHS